MSVNALQTKISNIIAEVESQVSKSTTESFYTDWYGAVEIDPKYLTIRICVQTKSEQESLGGNLKLKKVLQDILAQHKYPKYKSVLIIFDSQEEIDEESAGNNWHHWR